VDLPVELQQQSPGFAREQHTLSSFMVIQAAWRCCWPSSSPSSDVVLWGSDRGRRDLRWDGLGGFFVTPLVLRLDLAVIPAVAEMLSAMYEELAAWPPHVEHQDVPFEVIVGGLKPSTRSLTHQSSGDVMLALATNLTWGYH